MRNEFLKFYNREYDDFGAHTMVSARIKLPQENFDEVEKLLKSVGITFRSPRR